MFNQVANAMRIHRISENNFRFNFITFRHRNLSHIVAEAYKACILKVVPPRCGPAPFGNSVNRSGIFPVAGHNLTPDFHSGCKVAEFTVAMRALVEIHEIHIDLVPGDITIILSMKMQQGKLQ